MSKVVIFCDFDGTITKKDNIISIMKEFALPGWKEITDDILQQNISIQDGVRQLFSLIPSTLQEDIVSFVMRDAEIREGFSDFVQFTREQNIPLYVVSGGIDFFVHPVLELFGPFDHIYCNKATFDEERIAIHYPHACDADCTKQDCGCCKPSIMRKLSDQQQTRIVIGDSVTDFEAAKLADVVIAIDFLAETCEKLDIPYTSFETFTDCIDIVKEQL
ncbi:2-hydroxy-3-keto-5-methylthiopentenyl-1-phosphate phosphatase [Sporosarcina sp. P12(2017)]|uniref:2-hydroxy-3-keto-5-methylthiopentenyl-1- phosphate phosphatase n=1 Tax=unclassified Sporosarcina TaxID=2647733 RepID=UPI000C16E9CE|nr:MULTISPECIES: 2-hydroxy-3-keto-5-methylthiopentenyl-1-phosphate phosphatase [unclassified Sporosarcina]PIC56928.1 2-hydroxy-3-keto-5-methylthiopentenyl-1-phosphate phosphatase [Sporosarcina sp. P10]PIC60323.1 2-hydroxy-3-keto-5-methylthiopentenyl-1-phosphate phosphatase [Sporosarcina sp. P12(2017)]